MELPHVLDTWSNLLHPDDKDRSTSGFEEYLKEVIDDKEKIYEQEFRMKKKDGTYLWILARGGISDWEDGVPARMLGTHVDLTDRKKVEEEITHVNKLSDFALDLTKAGYWDIDYSDPDYYISSERAAKIFGEHPKKDWKYHLADEWYSRIEAADKTIAEETAEKYQGALDGKYENYDAVYPYKRPVDGKTVWIRAIGDIVRNEKGEPIHMYGVAQDITDFVLSQKEVQSAKEAADAANEAKSVFLANMSHEIRTPMNAVLGFTELLMGMITEPKQKEYLNSIQSSGKSLLGLINDILDLSKVEAGKLDLEYAAVNAKAVFEEMKSIFSQKMSEKGLDFIVEVDPDLPNMLVLDEIRVRQVLLNIIGNAVKFTDKGYVKVSAKNIYPDDDRSSLDLIISVEDTGIGIPDDQKDKIFGAFDQQSGQSSSKYGGTGLGLAITKKLVDMMNGEILVTGEVGKGSTFKIILKEVAVAAVDDQVISDDDFDPDSITFEKAYVLVVDDIEVNRKLVLGYLEPFGFKLSEAENGKEAIEIIKKEKPDLVLMDMKMPIMDGYEATKILKDDPKLKIIPVIALTASTLKESEDEIRKFTDGYLRKPVSRNDLVKELMKYLKYETSMPETVSEEASEEAADIEPSEAVDGKVKEKLPELIKMLEEKKDSVWNDLRETLTINEIEDFASEMKELGVKYQYPPLSGWGKRLENQAGMFEMDAMSKTLDDFPKLIKDIKSNI